MVHFTGQHIPTIQLEGTQVHGLAPDPNQFEAYNQYHSEYSQSLPSGEQPPLGASMANYPSDYER